MLLLYPLWAFFQQYLVCAYFTVRAENLLPSRFTLILVASLLFGTLHLPNLFLTVTIFMAGLLWIGVFLRWRNLYANALSHGLVAVVAPRSKACLKARNGSTQVGSGGAGVSRGHSTAGRTPTTAGRTER